MVIEGMVIAGNTVKERVVAEGMGVSFKPSFSMKRDRLGQTPLYVAYEINRTSTTGLHISSVVFIDEGQTALCLIEPMKPFNRF